jgi:small-conductance mechanosensitive channel
MSTSSEPRAALVSPEAEGTIMAIIDLDKEMMGSEDTTDAFVQAPEVLMRIAQYSQPVRTIQAVCNHPAQIITLQKQITDLQTKQFLPPPCDHTTMEQQIQQLKEDLDKARKTPRTVGTEDDLRQELDDMTRDARSASTAAASLRTQLANALSLAARVAPIPHQQQEDRGQKFPDSPDFSGSDRTQLRGCIAQLRMVIRHTPSRFPNEQAKMRYSFNRLSGFALK